MQGTGFLAIPRIGGCARAKTPDSLGRQLGRPSGDALVKWVKRHYGPSLYLDALHVAIKDSARRISLAGIPNSVSDRSCCAPSSPLASAKLSQACAVIEFEVAP